MGSKATAAMVGMLAVDYEPDVIILVESEHGLALTVEDLNVRTGRQYQIPFCVTDRFQFFVNMPADRVQPVYDGAYMSIKDVHPILGDSFILACVHLPSKLHLDAGEQAALCSRWVSYVCKAEARLGHARTVVIGDLNMNPFEPGVVGAEGFHAVSSRKVVARRTRTVLGEQRLFFYNPMWSLMGDAADLPGTYYYVSSSPIAYFWNTFDQVLLRPKLAQHFAPGDAIVVSSIGDRSLLGPGEIPNKEISDHLPLVATLRLEDVTDANEEFVGRLRVSRRTSYADNRIEGTG
jgi:hypothetical protein